MRPSPSLYPTRMLRPRLWSSRYWGKIIADPKLFFCVHQVIDKDTLSKDDPMGEIQIPLWEMDLFNVNDNVIGSSYLE